MGFKEALKFPRHAVASTTVEPILFCHAFAMGLHFVTNETLLVEKVCRTEMSYCDCICNNLLSDPELLTEKKLVQQDVAKWVTIISYVQNVPGLLISLVVGPWSDKHGRKRPLVIAMFLRTLTYIGFFMNAYFLKLPVYLMVVSWIPTSIFGGFIFGTCLSYLSDITTENNRTKRISVLSGLSFMGIPLGSLIGGIIKEKTGFLGVYGLATAFLAMATIYSVLRIEETRHSDASIGTIVKDFFNLKNFKESMATIFRKRQGKGRKHVVLSLLSLGLLSTWLSK